MLRRRRIKGGSFTVRELKQGLMDGTIPSACADTGATSTAGTTTDPFLHTGETSTKVFSMPTGAAATASTKKKLLLKVRSPADEVHIVPGLQQTLLSGSKFADAGYVAVYDEDEVNFYNKGDVKIDADAVIRGYRCPRTGLWRVPLQPIITTTPSSSIRSAANSQTTKNTMYPRHWRLENISKLPSNVPTKSPLTTCTNSQASNRPYDTYMPPQGTPSSPPGSKPFVVETTPHGLSSMSRMYPNISQSQRKLNLDTCDLNAKASDQPR